MEPFAQVGGFIVRQIADVALAAALLPPQLVEGCVHRDPGQPRDERILLAALVIAKRKIGFNETLLDDLLDLLAPREEAISKPRYQLPVSIEEARECRFVASQRHDNQLVV